MSDESENSDDENNKQEEAAASESRPRDFSKSRHIDQESESRDQAEGPRMSDVDDGEYFPGREEDSNKEGSSDSSDSDEE